MTEIRFVLVHAPWNGGEGGLFLTCRRGKDPDDVSVSLRGPGGMLNSWESIAGASVVTLEEAVREAMRGAPREDYFRFDFCYRWALERVRGALQMYGAPGWKDEWNLLTFGDLPWPDRKEVNEERNLALIARGGQL